METYQKPWPKCEKCGLLRKPEEVEPAGSLDGNTLYKCKDQVLCNHMKEQNRVRCTQD